MRKAFFAMAALLLAAFVAAPASAELPFTIYGQAGFGKWMEDGAPDGGLGFGGGIIYPLSNPAFAIGGELNYLMLGKYDLELAEVSVSAIPVTGQAYYMIPTSGDLGGYLTGGLGFYMMRSNYDGPELPFGIDGDTSDTDLGINLGGGIKFGAPEKKMKFGADLKYHIVMTEGESTNIITAFGRVYFE